jgi:hypothetical protein
MEISPLLSIAKKHTWLPECRLLGVAEKIRECTNTNIKGCFVECGVQYGGTVCFMKAFAKLTGSTENVYAFDSFEGLPPPTEVDISITGKDAYKMFQEGPIFTDCCVSMDRYKDTEKDFGVLDEIKVIKGWFKDSLVNLPQEPIAVLRADGDWYESTRDILINLFSMGI